MHKQQTVEDGMEIGDIGQSIADRQTHTDTHTQTTYTLITILRITGPRTAPQRRRRRVSDFTTGGGADWTILN